MPRGVLAIAETKEDAEREVLKEAPQLRILRSREIDLAGLPPLRSGPLSRHWVVVVEHPDPEEEAKLPQDDDPETQCERATRQMYLKLAIDPDLLLTGVAEEFPCPKCSHKVRAQLRTPREVRYPEHAQCPECRTHLTRASRQAAWAIVHPTPPPTCIFCGARANTREHVIPKWISKQLGINDFLPVEGAIIGAGIAPRKQPISFGSYRERIFCGDCNTHFKHLEDAVIPLIVPMAKGRSVSLDQENQALLSLWADKTAMALIAATPEFRGLVPADHRRAVRTAGRVADNTWVAFFRWRGGPVVVTGQNVITDHKTSRHDVYASILTFAELGFYVIGFLNPLDRGESIEGDRPPIVQFWPNRSRLVHWPPPTPIDRTIQPLMGFVPLHRD